MYRTCAFCNAKLDGDGGPSGLGVGRRFAFDEWNGRLWVVCPRCARWNLTPLDDRLERIEALARAARDGRVAAATDQVALIRWNRYDLVRVGRPPRAELAPWRYGERLQARRRDRLKVVVPAGVAIAGLAIAVNVAAGGSLGVFVWNLPGIADMIYLRIVGNRRVSLLEPPVCERCGSAMELRARHVQFARVVPEPGTDLAVLLSCPHCHREGALVTGPDAAQALRQGLTYLNANRSGRRRAAQAAGVIDEAGGSDRLVRQVAGHGVPLKIIRPHRRLALEMAVDEQAELQDLEQQWRDAEELAEIADGTLSTTPDLEEQLRRIRERHKSQPDS
jgi:hypothetical protein